MKDHVPLMKRTFDMDDQSFTTSLPSFLVSEEKAGEEVFPLNANETFTDFAGNFTELMLGPRRDALYIVVPITIIYVSIFLTGIIGNVSTCIVIARNKSMHTATNYYLFSLAISDLLLLVSGLPQEVYSVWSKYPYVFGENFCVLRGLAAETSTNATVLTITAFTMERYVAICHPFLSHTMSKLSRAIKLILVIWLVALSFAIPQALQFGIVEHPSKNPDLVMCTLKTVILEHSFEMSTFLFFVVPMTLITVLYALIGLKLRKSNMMKRDSGNVVGKSSASTQKERNCRHHTGKSSRRVLKMLVAVVVAFFICWAPFHVQRLIAIYGTNSVDHISSKSPWMECLYLIFTYVSGVLYYISTSINPILYNIMSNKFREAFMETLARCCLFPGLKGRRQQRTYSTLSRSRQRTPRIFGCGGRGARTTQDSTDCSGNSVRDDSLQQTNSVGGENVFTNASSKSVQSHPTGKRSASRRTLNTEIGTSDTNISETCNSRVGSGKYRGRSTGSCKVKNGRSSSVLRRNDENTVSVEISRTPGSPLPTKVRNTTATPIHKSSSTIKWRLFKWLSSHKPLKSDRRVVYSCSEPGENMIIDVGENHPEYSLTQCNISNSSLRDVDVRAMNDELSAYMDEVHMREMRSELKTSDNG